MYLRYVCTPVRVRVILTCHNFARGKNISVRCNVCCSVLQFVATYHIVARRSACTFECSFLHAKKRGGGNVLRCIVCCSALQCFSVLQCTAYGPCIAPVISSVFTRTPKTRGEGKPYWLKKNRIPHIRHALFLSFRAFDAPKYLDTWPWAVLLPPPLIPVCESNTHVHIHKFMIFKYIYIYMWCVNVLGYSSWPNMHVYRFIFIYIYVHTCTNTYTHMNIYTYMCIYLYTITYICIYTCTYT